MNWLQLHPDELIERIEPAEALAQLRQLERLEPGHLVKLDAFLHHWTLVLLQRANDPEGVQEVLTLCEIASDLAPDGDKGSAMQQRWSGFEDLLEGKRRLLQASSHVAPIQLKQQEFILGLIEQAPDGRVKQKALADQLQLSKGRVSQILGVLESRALITRQRHGKESWVSMGANPSQGLPPTTGTSTPPARVGSHIGANVFSLRKAA